MSPKLVKVIKVLIILILLVIIANILDQVTLTRPAYPGEHSGDPAPARPKSDDPPFYRVPFATRYAERRAAYRRWVLLQPTPEDRGGVWTDILKLDAGAIDISEKALQDGLDFVNQRQDPSDFTMNAFVRLYYLYKDDARLSQEQKIALRDAMLNYKYWLDEPNQTFVEMWTENHQILSASSEYLAGQLFPDETFSNDGLSGQQKMAKARQRILRWIELRARTGFAEWDSTTYYPEDLAPLLNLVDFAEDAEVATRATMLVDTILFDTLVDSFYGMHATSHGRITANGIKSAAGDSLITLQALAWGLGRFQSTSNMGVIALATSRKYTIPPVLEAIALDMPPAYTNLERHSIPANAESAVQYGISLSDVNDAPIWWGFGAFTTPEFINLTIKTADAWNLWHYPDFKDLKDIAKVLQAVNGLSLASRLLDPDPNGVLMSEVNKITYRTPDYQLSSAQDYRKGEKGYQQHIWQATLDPYAVVFVSNPDSLRADDRHRPSYWSANGRNPRTGQYKNVLVALYDIDHRPSAPPPLEARHYAFTHAYFPRWAFDEVREVPAQTSGGWIFGHRGDGYVALYSHQPYRWTEEGPDAGQEVIALGYQNVWLCQLGRQSVDGSFDEFVGAITSAALNINGLEVFYQAPGVGELRFAWEGPLRMAGKEVALRDYPRWENPYTRTLFGSLVYEIEFEGLRLMLDFNKGTRLVGDQ